MTPQEIGKFTHKTISPILERAQKKLEASDISTQLKLPHGDNVQDGVDVYAVDIGQILYATPSKRMIKVEVDPKRDAVIVSTEANPIGESMPLEGVDADALSSRVDRLVNELIEKERAEQ